MFGNNSCDSLSTVEVTFPLKFSFSRLDVSNSPHPVIPATHLVQLIEVDTSSKSAVPLAGQWPIQFSLSAI